MEYISDFVNKKNNLFSKNIDFEKYKILNSTILANIITSSSVLFLQRLHTWSKGKRIGKIIDGIKWVFCNGKKWAHQIGISERNFLRIKKKLIELDILHINNFNQTGYDRTHWYSINWEALKTLVFQPPICHNGLCQNVITYTYNKHIVKDINNNSLQENDFKESDLMSNSVITDSLTTEIPEVKCLPDKNLDEGLTLECPSNPEILHQDDQYWLKLYPGSPKPIDGYRVPKESIPEEHDEDNEIDCALKQVEIVNEQMRTPFPIIRKENFKRSYQRLMNLYLKGKSSEERTEYYKSFCADIIANDLLTGRKIMPTGGYFNFTISHLLSGYFFKDWLEGVKFFRYSKIRKDLFNALERDKLSSEVESLFFDEADIEKTSITPFDARVKKSLHKSLGTPIFLSWFHKSGFVAKGLKDGYPDFYLDSPFRKGYVMTHFRDQMNQAFKEAFEDDGFTLKNKGE